MINLKLWQHKNYSVAQKCKFKDMKIRRGTNFEEEGYYWELEGVKEDEVVDMLERLYTYVKMSQWNPSLLIIYAKRIIHNIYAYFYDTSLNIP